MTQKNVCFFTLGLLLPLLLLACTPQVQIEGAAQENTSSPQTAVPPTAASTTTATALPQAPLPRATEAPDHPEGPTPLPTKGLEIKIGATTEVHPTSQPADEPTLQPALQAWVDLAKEDLTQRLDVSLEEIDLLAFELKKWPDGSFGCPQPGMSYTQVPQEGYLITLQAKDQVYNYHGGAGGNPFLCLNLSLHPEEIVTRPALPNIKEIATKIVPPPRD